MVNYVVFCPGDPSSNPVLVIFSCVFPSHKKRPPFLVYYKISSTISCVLLLGLKLGHLKDETYLIPKLDLSSNLG